MPKFAREEGSGALREKDKAFSLSVGLYSQEVSAGSKRTLKVALVPTRPTKVGPGCCGKVESAFGEKLSETHDTQVPESLKNAGFGCFFSDSIGGFLQISEFSFWRPRLDHDLHFEPCPEQHRCQSRIVSTSSSILNTSLLRHSRGHTGVWHI